MRCEARAPSSWLGYCRCELPAGHEDVRITFGGGDFNAHRCPHGEMWADKVDHELFGGAALS